MAVKQQGAVIYPGRQQDNSPADDRYTQDRSLVVSQSFPRLLEATLRDQVFHAAMVAAGVTPGTVIGTAASAVLYNPAGSQVHAVLTSVRIGVVSGTIGQGFLALGLSKNILTAPTGSAMTVTPGKHGGATPPKCSALYTATLAVTPALVDILHDLGVTQSNAQANEMKLDGDRILEPGNAWSFEEVAAAGTTPKLIYAFSWLELPI